MVQDLLDSCIVQPSRSSFSTPMVMVRKKHNSWRMHHDYRDLNKITINDEFPIPNIVEVLDELHGVVYFTNLYCKAGYH
jgi:putative transposase